MSMPRNPGLLNRLSSAVTAFWEALFPVPLPDNTKVGFKLNQLKNLLDVLAANLGDRCGYSPLATFDLPLGWYVILPNPAAGVNKANVYLDDIVIRQLFMRNNPPAGGPEFFTLPADFRTGTTYGPLGYATTRTHFDLSPDPTRPFHNDLIATNNGMLGNLSHFKPATELGFFTTDQLLILKRHLDDHPDTTVLFSGYDLFLGRLGAKHNSDEVEQLDGRVDVPDAENWFVIKAEVIRPADVTLEDTGSQSQTSAASIRSNSAEDPCDEINEFGIPLSIFSSPCPPIWMQLDAAMGQLLAIVPKIDLDEAACAYRSVLGSNHHRDEIFPISTSTAGDGPAGNDADEPSPVNSGA